jgi:predicted Fe-Mo cluster-binding NifX family protein
MMSYKIALTSSDGKTIDTHFGQARTFRILEVDEASGAWEFEEFRTLPPESCQAVSGCAQAGGGACGERAPVSGCGHQDGRLRQVAGLLSDCRYVLSARIGKKPHMALQRAGITALESPADISFALSKLHAYHVKYARLNTARREYT